MVLVDHIFFFAQTNHQPFYFSSRHSCCVHLLHSDILRSPQCFLITRLGMLALFRGSCHGDRRVPLVGHFRHNLQMLCQMQVVHTGRIRQGRAQRWDADPGHCLQLDRRQIRMLLGLIKAVKELYFISVLVMKGLSSVYIFIFNQIISINLNTCFPCCFCGKNIFLGQVYYLHPSVLVGIVKS